MNLEYPRYASPTVPECRDHHHAYKNSDAEHDDDVVTESAGIFEYLANSAH